MRGRWLVAALTFGVVCGPILRPGAAASLSLGSQPLTPFRTCSITATPAAAAAISDASVRQASPGSNFGAATTNNVASGNGVNRRLYLSFDLATCSPAIPAAAVVRLATLRLYVTAVPAACRTVDLFRVPSPWSEVSITWTNQPFGTALNSPPAASASGSYTIGSPVGCGNRTTATYLTGATVTADVAAFVAGSATNYGWMLRDDAEGSATTYTSTYSAKELGTVAQAPQLVVTYVAVP